MEINISLLVYVVVVILGAILIISILQKTEFKKEKPALKPVPGINWEEINKVREKNKQEYQEFYRDKENCKCYQCLNEKGVVDMPEDCNFTVVAPSCQTNCSPPIEFKYGDLPCSSCELRNFCFTNCY